MATTDAEPPVVYPRQGRNRWLGIAMVVAALGIGGVLLALRGEEVSPLGCPSGSTPDQLGPADAQPGEEVSPLGCPSGSTPDQPGPSDQERPRRQLLDFAGIAFDRGSGRLVLTEEGRTWTFDVCSNTWVFRGVGGARWRNLVYHADANSMVALGSGSVEVYDHNSSQWDKKGADPTRFGFPVYDPVSGLLFVFDIEGYQLRGAWTYDVYTQTWAEVEQKGSVPTGMFEPLLAYDASADRVVLSLRAQTYEFDPRSYTWSEAQTDTPDHLVAAWVPPRNLITYDEANQRTVIFSGGTVAAYDATSDEWEILFDGGDSPGIDPFDRNHAPIVYDPVNRRVVMVGGEQGPKRLDDVWAFDVATREWTLLLGLSAA